MVEAYKNGQVKEVTENGVRTYYFENGMVKAHGPFDGKMHEEWSFYRKTGELWQVGQFEGDIKKGSWIRYDRNGEIEKAVEFKNGKEIRL